jgi:DNA adenine methylase
MSTKNKTTLRPILRWAGSKRKLLHHLLPYWDEGGEATSKYIEPFMGSASYFFSISPEEAILSDINEDLVNCYRVLRDHPRKLRNIASAIPRNKETYYEIREINLSKEGVLKRAAYFLYLNRNCFNGLYRTNLSGKFNVPFGAHKSGEMPSLEEFYALSKVLAKAKIICSDYKNILDESVSEGDFVYLDPPYIIPNERVFSEYSASVFDSRELNILVQKLHEIELKGAKFLLSFAASEHAEEIFSNWNISEIRVYRSMSSKVSSRKKTKEFIVSNIDLHLKDLLLDAVV